MEGDFRLAEIPTPFDQQGLRAIFAKEGMDRWPVMKLFIDGTSIHPKNKPFWSDGDAFVPIQVVSERLGYTYTYNELLGKYEISKTGQSISISPTSEWAVINGEQKLMKRRPVQNDRTIFLSYEDVSMILQVSATFDAQDGQLFMASGVRK